MVKLIGLLFMLACLFVAGCWILAVCDATFAQGEIATFFRHAGIPGF